MAQAHHDDRVAFALGEDYAFYALPLPDAADEAMRRGHQSGMERFSRKRQPVDRFVKKWLQIRVGAWNRNRVFDLEVTPTELAIIDNKFCPVSGVELTHATGLDTDWSVDRLDNDGAYAWGNLVVLSSRVNKIKDDRSWQEVRSLAEASEAKHGLTALEWQKLWRLVSTAVTVEDLKVVRECLEPATLPRGLASVWSLTMQDEFVPVLGMGLKDRNDFWDFVRSGVTREHFEAVEIFREMVSTYARATPVSVRSTENLFSDAFVWASFKGWWSFFTSSRTFKLWCAQVLKTAVSSGNSIKTNDTRRIEHCLSTRGYN